MNEQLEIRTSGTPADNLFVVACRRCATPVVLVDLTAEFRRLLGVLDVGDRFRCWHEHHLFDEDDGGVAVVLREHTRQRCTRARAGDPEPVDRSDVLDDDEDQGDELQGLGR